MTNYTNKLTLIKRTNPPCPNCTAMQFALEGSDIPFDTIDITDEPGAVEKYDIFSVPVLLFEDNKGQTTKLNGVQPVELVKEFLED